MAGFAVALASACGSAVEKAVEIPAPHGPAGVSAPSPGARYALAWSNTDRRPIGEVTAIGSTMVGLVVDDARLFVVGLDPATGHELWRQPTTPGAVTVGVPVHVAKIGDDKVAYLRSIAEIDSFAQLVVADAGSGRDVAVSPPALFTTYPFACMNEQDACALSSEGPGRKVHEFRLEIATGTYVADSLGLSPTARLLDASMVDLGDRPGNTLGWLRDGRLLWNIPVQRCISSRVFQR